MLFGDLGGVKVGGEGGGKGRTGGGRGGVMSVKGLMQLGYMELRLIIEWARKVPGRDDCFISVIYVSAWSLRRI